MTPAGQKRGESTGAGRCTLAQGGRWGSGHSAVLIQQGDQVSDSLGVGFVGVELVAELNTIASSLLLSLESRTFSFSICSVSLLSCSISFSSCFVRSREALICFLMSGLCRQLSVCNHKRHRGNDEPHAPLLLELEVDACREGDVVIGAEQGDQGNQEAGMGLDDSLAIKPRVTLKQIRTLRQVWLRFDRRDDPHQDREPNRPKPEYIDTTFSPERVPVARGQQDEEPKAPSWDYP